MRIVDLTAVEAQMVIMAIIVTNLAMVLETKDHLMLSKMDQKLWTTHRILRWWNNKQMESNFITKISVIHKKNLQLKIMVILQINYCLTILSILCQIRHQMEIIKCSSCRIRKDHYLWDRKVVKTVIEGIIVTTFSNR